MNNTDKKILVRGNTLIVGVDIGKKVHWAKIFNRDGLDTVRPFKFKNNKDGFLRLESQIQKSKLKEEAEKIVIGMEPTGHYWKNLAFYLEEKGYQVVIVNPGHVKKSKELEDNSQSKTDRKDAGIIADLVWQGKFQHCLLHREVYAELRNLSVARARQRKNLNSSINQLKTILDEYFPEYTEVFKCVLGKASMWVLRNIPFPQDIKNTNREDLIDGLKQASKSRVGEKRAARLIEKAEESVGLKIGVHGAKVRLKNILDEIEFYHKKVVEVEAYMKDCLNTLDLSKYLLSIPGIGVVTAASFLGEIGDIANYTHHRQLQKLAGLNLVEESSGEKQGKRKISKRGRPYLRCILYQASLTLVAKNKEFKALYKYLRNRPNNPLNNMKALTAICNKLLRVMFTLLKKESYYDPAKVLGQYRESQLKEVA